MNRSQLHELIVNDHLDEAIEALHSHPSLQRRQQELLLIGARWQKLQSERRTGQIAPEEANREQAQIRRALLELIEMAERKPQKSARRPGLLIGFLLAISAFAVAGFFVLNRPRENTETSPENKAPGLPSTQQTASAKTVEADTLPFRLKAAHVGEVSMQIRKARIGRYKPGYNLLELDLRVQDISGWGQNFSEANFQLRMGAELLAPHQMGLGYVAPNSSASGSLSFLLPATANSGSLRVLFGIDAATRAETELPLRW